MSDKIMPKCKSCSGTGFVTSLKMDDRGKKLCSVCEGLGVKLNDEIDEGFKNYLSASGDKLYEDEEGFINLD